ncbi:hypothetical protein [Microcystis aeruginosa]|nr:hypothetical protein [Microcystis aeruginosa]MDB9393949.1 hypothetical protein [Microcystis aeruginosa CS-573]
MTLDSGTGINFLANSKMIAPFVVSSLGLIMAKAITTNKKAIALKIKE